jgi:predicted P-loop ATPase
VICWQGKREDEGAPADAHEIETRWRDCSSLKGNTKPVTHGSLNEDAHRMLGWPKRHLARDKTAESMFGDVAVVGAPSIVPGATAGATSGGIPLLEGQLAVAEMGRPILERYIEMVGRPAAPFELQLPADHPLFELLGFALASVMAQQRVDDAASDVLAVLAAAHPPTFEVVRDNLGLNESGSLSAACARFAGKIEYEFKTKGDWIRIGRENHINSTHPANFHRLLRIMNCELRHNEWLERDEIRGERWTEWTYVDDAVVARLLTEARKNGFTPAKDFVWDTVRAFAEDTRVDPARDRLQVLETAWDRKPRLDEWLSAAFGVPADIYHRVVGRRIVGGLVRRIREPGAKIDEMAVLIGSQGISKSTAVKMLAPITDSFTDGVKLGEESKELILLLAGCAVVEVGEMSKRTTAGIEAIKVMVAKTHDRGRTVWNRAVTNRPRRNIFVGTSNADTPLMDITGNRRFLPLRCVRVDLEWMAHNRDQLIGEACALQTKGETFDLPPDTWDIAAIHQEAARERADYELLLQQWFAQDEPEEHIPPEIAPVMGRASEFVIISDLAKLLRNELRQRTSQNDVAAAMRKLGFRRTTQKLNRKAEDMWLRGEWCAHGAGMVQHVVAPPNGHHGVRHIPRGTTPPPPPPR